MSEDTIDCILRRDPRYRRAAYEFVLEIMRRPAAGGQSTQELLESIRVLALERFGPLARTVLADWGITETRHIGEVVFNLVDEKAMRKTEDDDIAQFDDVYDFAAAFPDETGPVAILRNDEDDEDDD